MSKVVTRNILKKILFVVSIASIPTLTHAGGVDGGANGLFDGESYSLIEDSYVDPHNLSRLCGYPEFAAKLNAVRATFPNLGAQLDKVIGERDWYEVSAELDEIPEVHKRLGFTSLQFAKQPAHGHEIFINKRIHEELCASNLERAGKELMHEALMALQGEKREDNVRGVINKLYAQPMNPVEVQDALAKFGFGVQFTADQIKLQRKLAVQKYLDAMKVVTKAGLDACDQNASLPEIKLEIGVPNSTRETLSFHGQWMKRTDKARLNRASNTKDPDRNKPESLYDTMVGYDRGFMSEEDTFRHSGVMVMKSHSGGDWYSPFRSGLQNWIGLGKSAVDIRRMADDVVEQACDENKAQFGQLACEEFKQHESRLADLDISSDTHEYEPAQFDREPQQRTAALEAAYGNLSVEKFDKTTLFKVKEELARNPAFLNLVAVNLVEEKPHASREDNREEWFGSKTETPYDRRFAALADKVMQRRDDLAHADKAYLRRLVCSSVSSVDRDLDRIAEGVANAGQSRPNTNQGIELGNDPVDNILAR